MSFLLAGMVFTMRIETGPKVGSTDKLVLLALADNAHDNGRCWPGLAYLAEKCEMSEDTVRRSIQRLVDAGYVAVIERHAPNGRQTTNAYQINRARIEASRKVGLHDATHPPAPCDPLPPHDATPEGGTNTPPRTYQSNLSGEPPPQPPKGGRRIERLPVPDWMPADAWAMWQRHRKHMTADAHNLHVRTLTNLRDEGHDPREVIEQSINAGWKGLFPLKNHARNGYPASSTQGAPVGRHQRNLEIMNEIRERALGGGTGEHGLPASHAGADIDGTAVAVD